MNFDHIIMNPPYDKNLHLKILQEAIKHSDDVVNLSPIRWLQDPLAEYKKNSDWKKFEDIRKHIESLDVVSAKDAQNYFGADVPSDLGVYHLTKNGGFDDSSLRNALLQKVYEKVVLNSKEFEIDKKDGVRVKFSKIFGKGGHGGAASIVWQKLLYFTDGIKDGKPWYEHYNKNQFSKCLSEIPYSVKFENEDEAENFIDAASSKLGKYYYSNMSIDQNVYTYYFLWLPTYTHPWTDEMLYEYFDLTEEEIKEIEQEIK